MSERVSAVGAALLPAYFVLTILIGWIAHRRGRSAEDYLNAGRSLPLWVVSIAFLAANCGALEVVGLSGMAAAYGVRAFHFYWIGAVPAMLVLALWVMPAYVRSGIRSIPEYLERRYGTPVRALNAWVLAAMMLALTGINLYAIAQVLEVVLHLTYGTSISISAVVVLAYVLLGGVRATIYNEVFQLVVMIGGLVPLTVRTFRLALPGAHHGDAAWHLWTTLPNVSPGAPLDRFGLIVGLGFVLSFSYWCTDFVLMQRALAARTEIQARQVPLWAGFGKLAFSLVVVLPGLAAHTMLQRLGVAHRIDQALPAMMTIFYGPTLLGLGLTALTASLMSGLAANVSGFAAVWTEDIYRKSFYREGSERHYVHMGQVACIAAIAAGLAGSYISFYFKNVMDYVQLIFSMFSAPFWAIFLLGILAQRVKTKGALRGFAAGIAAACLHQCAVAAHWIHYGSVLTGDFYAATLSFTVAAVVGLSARDDSVVAEQNMLLIHWSDAWHGKYSRRLLLLSVLLLSACIALNWWWR